MAYSIFQVIAYNKDADTHKIKYGNNGPILDIDLWDQQVLHSDFPPHDKMALVGKLLEFPDEQYGSLKNLSFKKS